MTGEISNRDKKHFIYQAVNMFISAVKLVNIVVNGDRLAFRASLKWPFNELQFLHIGLIWCVHVCVMVGF